MQNHSLKKAPQNIFEMKKKNTNSRLKYRILENQHNYVQNCSSKQKYTQM